MILTAIVSSADGLGYPTKKTAARFAEVFGQDLADHGDTFEVLDIDRLALVQQGKTTLRLGEAPLDHRNRVYLVCNISPCPQRERRLHNAFHALVEQGLPVLNRSFGASPELEVNKTAMQAFASRLGVRCIPSMELNHHMPMPDILTTIEAIGLKFPVLLKPNRLMMGAGILFCDNARDFEVNAGIVRQLPSDYLIQEYVPNAGDLRVFASRNMIFGNMLREPAPDDFRSNIALGSRVTQLAELPPDVVEQTLRIASRCDADFVAVDWLTPTTGSTYVFNEMCSSAASVGQGGTRAQQLAIAHAVLEIARQQLASLSNDRS